MCCGRLPACRVSHSQLDVSLLEVLQCVLPLSRGQPGWELGGLDSSKQLDQEVKSEEETELLQLKLYRWKHVKVQWCPTCEQPLWSWWSRGWGWASSSGWSGGWGGASCSMCREHKTPETTKTDLSPNGCDSSTICSPQLTSYRQTLWEVKALCFLSCWRGAVGLTVGGAEESGLMEVQLL